jgi:galactose mutarotase-like enzyme
MTGVASRMSLDRICLSSAALRAEISPLGAELVSLVGRDGSERLWQGDPAIWGDRSPILFPVVGRLQGDRLRVGGSDLSMPIHGFARSMIFAVTQLSDASALFRLRASEETLASYPWDFGLDVTYTLSNATLTVAFTVRNHDGRPMPYMLGLHPGFRWPRDPSHQREGHFLEFDAPGSLACEIGRNGFRGEQPRLVSLTGRRLFLSDDLLDGGAAIFPDLPGRRVRFSDPAGETGIELDFQDFAHLALWTRPGAPFLCIEPWQALPHAERAAPDLSHVPTLGCGETVTHTFSITVA